MKFLVPLALTLITAFSQVFSCTGILLRSENESTVSGRTVEFGVDLEMSVAVIPRGYSFIGKSTEGKGLKYTSKYAAVGIFCFNEPALMDGINEKGLVAAAFYFPGYAEYGEITSQNQSQALSPIEFPNWILTQFATIEEVKSALNSVVIAPTILKDWGDAPPPMHYIVYDAQGKSIVIEPIGGKLVVHDNPIGVFTNSPTFDWHLTNLNNYINLTPENTSSVNLRDLKLSALGQGTGMLGAPGDFTPPSRFVRAAFYSIAAVTSKDGSDLVGQTFHFLNQFDIPLGAVRSVENGKTSYDRTWLTSVKSPETLSYYYRSYDDQSIKFLSLNDFNLNAKKIIRSRIQGTEKYKQIKPKK